MSEARTTFWLGVAAFAAGMGLTAILVLTGNARAPADRSDLCGAFENTRCGPERLLVQGKDGLLCCPPFIEGVGALRVKDGRVWFER